jgi:hypothetical protein
MRFNGIPTWEYIDYPIQGQMIQGKFSIPDYDEMVISDKQYREHARQYVTNELAQKIIEHKLAEWTRFQDPIYGVTNVMVRAYLAKDRDVHLLRTLKP